MRWQRNPKISRYKYAHTWTHMHGAYALKTITYWVTDNLSKLAHVSFVWELKWEDSWGISGSNVILRQYTSTTCTSQMIIYSLLSAQNVWINSWEFLGLQNQLPRLSCMNLRLLIHRRESCSVLSSALNQLQSKTHLVLFSICGCLHFILLIILIVV